MNGNSGKLGKIAQANQGLGSDQTSAGRNDLHPRNAFRRISEMAGVSELASEIKAAAEGENVAKAGRSDLHLPR
jgi:hypothetical protein